MAVLSGSSISGANSAQRETGSLSEPLGERVRISRHPAGGEPEGKLEMSVVVISELRNRYEVSGENGPVRRMVTNRSAGTATHVPVCEGPHELMAP